MKKRIIGTSLVVGFHLLASSAFAFEIDLGTAGGFNAFVFGNFNASASDTEGRLAAGGDVSLTGYSVGSNFPTTRLDMLVVGGDLTYIDGQVNKGNVVVGGDASTSGFSTPDGALTANTTVPVDFAAEQSKLFALSSALTSLTANGTAISQWGGVYLQGDGTSAVQVFNLNGEDLLNASSLKFNSGIVEGSTLVFNVSGVADGIKNFGMQDLDGYNVLFNFYEATSLTLTGVGVEGSILAPLADVVANYGQFNGTIIANSWDGGMELHNVPFEGTSAVPVPGTVFLLSIGLIGLVSARRRTEQ